MVPRREILELAAKWEVPSLTVEKDHVLGHLLSGISSHFSDTLVFKGGTCLRKCYFPDYRFSEDLDFTARSSDWQLTAAQLVKVCDDVSQHSGIRLVPGQVKPLLHKDIRKGDQVKIAYWGADHEKHQGPPDPARWTTYVKLEISIDEVLVSEPEPKQIIHPYSDLLLPHQPLPCYSLLEVVAEKLRALIQRSYTAPRDYYDLYMLGSPLNEADWQQVKEVFLAKMAHKEIPYLGPDSLISDESLQRMRNAWRGSLDHQIKPMTDAERDELIEKVCNFIKTNLQLNGA